MVIKKLFHWSSRNRITFAEEWSLRQKDSRIAPVRQKVSRIDFHFICAWLLNWNSLKWKVEARLPHAAVAIFHRMQFIVQSGIHKEIQLELLVPTEAFRNLFEYGTLIELNQKKISWATLKTAAFYRALRWPIIRSSIQSASTIKPYERSLKMEAKRTVATKHEKSFRNNLLWGASKSVRLKAFWLYLGFKNSFENIKNENKNSSMM